MRRRHESATKLVRFLMALPSLPALMASLALMVVAACGGGGDAPPDTTAATAPAIATTAVPDTGCPKTGDWRLCSVEDRLTRAGLVIERLAEPATHDFLSVEGVRFKVGAGEDEVQVFVYPTPAARIQDTGQLDSASVSPRGDRRSYRVPPLLVTSANLAAIVFTLNERTSERLSLALSAGLPQR